MPRGEIARGLEVVEFACGIPQLLKGGFSENVVDRGRRVLDPAAARCRGRHHAVQLPGDGAAVDGPDRDRRAATAFVLKPSEKDPSASNLLAELFAEAGLPDGVFNVVHGDKEAVDALLEHPDVAAVSFVGSTPSPATSMSAAPRRQAGPGARRCEEPRGRDAGRRPRLRGGCSCVGRLRVGR